MSQRLRQTDCNATCLILRKYLASLLVWATGAGMGSCRFKLARLLCSAWHPCPLSPVVTITGGGLKSFRRNRSSILFTLRARFGASCCAGASASGLCVASANNGIAFDPANLAPSDAAAGAEVREPLKQSPPTADQGFDARVFGAHFHHAAERSSIFVAKLFAYEFREEHRVSINHGHPECGSCGAPSLFPPPSIRNKPPLFRV